MRQDRQESALREHICEIGRRIWRRGFCAGNEGNHSVRLGPDRVLCTPTGVSKGFMQPEDLCVVDMDGQPAGACAAGRRPTTEVRVHLAVYRLRPDVGAVVHSHPPHATAFAIAGVPLPEGIHPEAELALGKVALAPYATPGTAALAQSIVPVIGPQTNTVLMGSHGSVSFGDGLDQAWQRLEVLDAYCRVLILCRQLGRVGVLSPEQVRELLEVKNQLWSPDARLDGLETGRLGCDNGAYLSLFGAGGVRLDDAQIQALAEAVARRLSEGSAGGGPGGA